MFFVGQSLQGFLPQLVSHPIASSPIGGDQELMRLGIEAFATVFPPSPDTLPREFRRFMIDAHIETALVMHQVLDAIRDGFSLRQPTIAIHLHPPLLPFRLPFFS